MLTRHKKELSNKGMNFLSLVLLFMISLRPSSLMGSTPLLIDESIGEQSVGTHLEYLLDPNSEFTIETLLAGAEKESWIKSEKEIPSFGFSNSTFWFRFTIANSDATIKSMFLELAYPLHDDMSFYFIGSDGSMRERHFGDLRPFAEREIQYRNFAFKLPFAPMEQHTIYLRLRSEGSLTVPIILWTPEKFFENSTNQLYGLGIFYGIMLVMVLYNSFLFLSIRDRNYIFYVLYIISHAMFQMGLNGLSFQYIFPAFPRLANMSIPFTLGMTALWLALFTMNFLQTSQNMKIVHRVLQFICGWATIIVGLSLFVSYELVIKQCALITIMVGVTVLTAAVISFFKGRGIARLFLAAFTLFMLGAIVAALRTFGLVPINFLTLYSAHIGSSLEVILLSLALADKLNALQREKNLANKAMIEGFKKLEIEVGRRNELQHKNNLLSDEINAATLQLVQADKMSMLGQLVAGVAHDIASPSQLLILSYSENLKAIERSATRVKALLGETDDPEAVMIQAAFETDFQQARLSNDQIKTAAERIIGIQTAILNQSRLDKETKEVPLKALIDECSIILHSKIRKWRVLIDCPDSLAISCRRTQIGQLITNLVSNAADELELNQDYVPQKDRADIMLRVSTSVTQSGKILAAIDIEDNGRGIPPDKIEKIFDAFYTTKEVGVGTGLGLSICKKIIESHSGTITVGKSTTLNGAWFHIELPTYAESSPPLTALSKN